MSQTVLEKLYAQAPAGEIELLQHFRASHPLKRLQAHGFEWEYLASGSGAETLLILPGLIGRAEMSFQHILRLEDEFRCLTPSYPQGLIQVTPLLAGLAAILHAEGAKRAHVLGGSYGGMLAQAFVRAYPEKVKRLILSHTGGPEPEQVQTNRRFISFLRLLPMGLLRVMLRSATRRSLQDAPGKSAFWTAYSEEMVGRLSKADLIARYQVAVDFDASTIFTTTDLQAWPGQILILEGDNDPVAEAGARQKLKALHPQACVHTFHGSGHLASIARLDEYIGVIKRFLQEGAC